MSWSRLLDTPLGQRAKAVYQADPGRHYHNWNHVLRLYWHATETFDLAYDANLDMAILAHDVIYDAKPNKEERSAAWLREYADTATEMAESHIRKTIDHSVTDDNRMVLLDLADFLYPEKSAANLETISKEFQALYGLTEQVFLQGNIGVMTGIHDRIKSSLPGQASDADQEMFAKVLDGIKSNLANAQRRLDQLSK